MTTPYIKCIRQV